MNEQIRISFLLIKQTFSLFIRFLKHQFINYIIQIIEL